MTITKLTSALAAGAIVAGALATSGAALAQQKTEISFARFFGACDADYGTSQDYQKARGECGVMTALVNHFNATNKDNIVVKPQIIEWGPYYQQLTARIAARDVPTIAVMHTSQIGDFVRSRIVEPIEDDLKAAGIDINDFTPHAKAGVTLNGKVHALPWDTHSWLWHINVGMFKQAGLVDAAGAPIVPKTVDELMQQAKLIKEKTGKPYFVMASVAAGDAGNGARSFWTMMYTQNASIFKDGNFDKADFNSPEAKNAFEVFERLSKEGYITKGTDGAGALGGFIGGNGAVLLTGTWRIDDMIAAAAKPESGLKEYTARIFPNLFKQDAVWADNHSWVMLRGGTNPQTRKAAQIFMKYLWDHNFDWARGGGHLPIRSSLMAEYAKLPERPNVMRITEIGRSLPHDVRRQFGFQSLIGEEVNNIINGNKLAAQAMKDAQERADQLLSRR
jgi:multiple sugar transport system substrate-binding protein